MAPPTTTTAAGMTSLLEAGKRRRQWETQKAGLVIKGHDGERVAVIPSSRAEEGYSSVEEEEDYMLDSFEEEEDVPAAPSHATPSHDTLVSRITSLKARQQEYILEVLDKLEEVRHALHSIH